MLIMLNLTGIGRVYWVPWWKSQTDHDGLWYLDAKWLGVQLVVYSREMGNGLSRIIRGQMEASRVDQPATN